jgi:lipopolysaccharide/colanic/teichoic acid biosynthesis glycosyltransferase
MLKRHFDILASLFGLILLSPLFLLLALLVKTGSKGPVFYKANRVGRDGKPFKLFKFRSMVTNADKLGPAVTGASDSRVTGIGRFLRKTKLDELPQLINVLIGEMSIVGPRPEDPRYVAHYTEAQRKILSVRPGITSPASVQYRHEESMLTGDNWETLYIEEIMPAKLAIDLEYVEKASLWQDIKLIFKTFYSIVSKKPAA